MDEMSCEQCGMCLLRGVEGRGGQRSVCFWFLHLSPGAPQLHGKAHRNGKVELCLIFNALAQFHPDSGCLGRVRDAPAAGLSFPKAL